MKTTRLLPLPILMLNVITKTLFYFSKPMFWVLAKIVDGKLANRIFEKLDDREIPIVNRDKC